MGKQCPNFSFSSKYHTLANGAIFEKKEGLVTFPATAKRRTLQIIAIGVVNTRCNSFHRTPIIAFYSKEGALDQFSELGSSCAVLETARRTVNTRQKLSRAKFLVTPHFRIRTIGPILTLCWPVFRVPAPKIAFQMFPLENVFVLNVFLCE